MNSKEEKEGKNTELIRRKGKKRKGKGKRKGMEGKGVKRNEVKLNQMKGYNRSGQIKVK